MTPPTVRTPADLADLRLWLADQWAPGHLYQQVAALQMTRRGPYRQDPAVYARWEHQTLRGATLWWVGPEMVDLLLATAAGVPDDVTWADLTPPSHAGLIVFAKPWLGIDSDQPERQVQVDAMLWGATNLPPNTPPRAGNGPGGVTAVSVSSYRLLDFTEGLNPDELAMAGAMGAIDHAHMDRIDGHLITTPGDPEARRIDGGTLRQWPAQVLDGDITPDELAAHGAAMLDGQPDGTLGGYPGAGYGTFARERGQSYKVTGHSWVPLGRSDWPHGDPIGQAPWEQPEGTTASFVEDRKVLAAMWTLLLQEGMTSRVVHQPDRPARRRAERAGVARGLSAVQVVTLRRPRAEHDGESTEPDPDGQGRRYTHQWVVQGHWAWRACGPAHSQRRLTFVRPHIKGPEGAPLHVPTRVNAWVK